MMTEVEDYNLIQKERYNIILSSDKNSLFIIAPDKNLIAEFPVNSNRLEKSIDEIIGRNFFFFKEIADSPRKSEVPLLLKFKYRELSQTDFSYLNTRLFKLCSKQQQI